MSDDRKRRVLIVDDSPAMRQLLTLAMARFGVTIDQADDGIAALKALKTTPAYDLVLLDINMPVMDGMKLLRRMQEDPACAATAVCVVTTDETSETEDQARRLGARHYLRKPVNRRSIEKVLADVFGLPPAG